MKNRNRIKNNLNYFVNLIWYGGIFLSVIITISVIIYNASAIKIIDFSFPTISFQMNRNYYQFNNRFLELRKLDKISSEFVSRKLAEELNHPTSKVIRKATKEFYNVDYDKIEKIESSYKEQFGNLKTEIKPLPVSFIPITKHYDNGFALRYFKINQLPQFPIGLSMYVLSLLFFLIMIAFNLKKGFEDYSTGSILSFVIMRRLRFIGIYFFLIEVVRVFVFFWINNSIAHTEFISGIKQAYNFELSDINFAWLIAGVCCFLMSQILKRGAELKEEMELTV